MTISLNQSPPEESISINMGIDSRVMPREFSVNESYLRQSNFDPMLKAEQNARNQVVTQYKNDIISIIKNDSFEPGFTSHSENYILSLSDESLFEYIREAANMLYLEHYGDPHILTGLLIMMGTLSYEEAEPQGQTMALGLLQHQDISVRDRAIQAFERWNSRKGLPVLKSLHCDKAWLQRYVDKVISYLERDGLD